MMEECNKGSEDAALTPEQLAIKMKRKEKNQKKKEKKRFEKLLEEERKKMELMRGPKDTRVKIITRDFADKLSAPLQFQDTGGWRTVTLTPTDFPSLDEIRNKSAVFAADVNCNSEGTRDAIEPHASRAREIREFKLNGKDVCNPSEGDELNVAKQNNEPKSKKVNFGPVTVNLADAIKKSRRNARGTRGGVKKEILVTGPYGDAVITVRRRTRARKREKEPLNGNPLDASQPERNKGKHREVPVEKKPTKLKQMILRDLETLRSEEDDNVPTPDLQASSGTSSSVGQCPLHYSDNIISDELNSAVSAFLSNIVRFQENVYERNPIKAAAKRRYVVGFREVRKYLLLKKVKILIVAPNIKADLPNGVLDNTIQDLVSLAALSEIPYVFALSRRIFGRITLKNVPVSVIAVLDYDGTEDEYKKVLECLQIARDEYQKTQPQTIRSEDAVTNEIIDNFLNFI